MPPRRAKTTENKQAAADKKILEFSASLQDGIQLREAQMRSKMDYLVDEYSKRITSVIKSLPKDLVKMNLYQYLQTVDESATSGDDEQEIETDENVPIDDDVPPTSSAAVRSTRSASAAPSRAPPADMQTAKRAPNHLRSQSRSEKTPKGKSFKIPTYITPKAGGDSDGGTVFRAPRPDEVAFSAAGSPLIAPDNMLNELLNRDEDGLSPESRTLATTLKTIIRKKMVTDTSN